MQVYESQIREKSSSLSKSPKRQEKVVPNANGFPKNYPKSETNEKSLGSEKNEDSNLNKGDSKNLNSKELNELRAMISALEKKNEAVLSRLEGESRNPRFQPKNEVEKIPKRPDEHLEQNSNKSQINHLTEKVKKYKSNLSKMYQILIDKDKEKESMKTKIMTEFKSLVSSLEKSNGESFKQLRKRIDAKVQDIERLEKSVVSLSDLFLVKNYEAKKAELENYIITSLEKHQQQEVLEMLDYISEEEIANIKSIETLQQALQCSEYRRMEIIGLLAIEKAKDIDKNIVQRLQEDLKIFENENCILSQKLENLESDFETLKKKSDDTEKRLKASEKFKALQEEASRNIELELSAEKEMLKLCKEEIQENQKTIDDELKTIQAMENRLKEKETVINNLKDILSEEKCHINELTEALEAKHEALNQLIDEKSNLIQEIAKKSKALEKTKNDFENVISRENLEIEELKSEKRSLEEFKEKVLRQINSKNSILQVKSETFKSLEDVKEFLDKICQNYHNLQVENDMKNNKIENLENENNFYLNENGSLKNSLSNLKHEMGNSSKEIEFSNLKNELESARKKLSSSTHERKSLLTINESLENEISVLKNEISSLQMALKQKDGKEKSFHVEIEKLTELNAVSKKEIETLKSEISNLNKFQLSNSQEQQLQFEIESLQEELQKKEIEISELKKLIEKSKAELDSKTEAFISQSQKISDALAKEKEFEKKLLEAKKENEDLKVQVLDSAKQAEAYLDELRYVKERENEHLLEIESSHSKASKLEKELKVFAEKSKGYEAKLDAAYAEMKVMQEEQSRLKLEISKVKANNQAKELNEEDFMNISQKSSFLEEEVESQKSRISLLQNELDLQIKKNNALERESKGLQSQVEILGKENTSLKAAKSEALSLIENKNIQMNKFEKEIEEMKKTLNIFKEKERELEEFKIRNKTLTNKLSSLQIEWEDSKGREERLATRNFELEESVSQLKESKNKFSVDLQDSKAEFKRKIRNLKNLVFEFFKQSSNFSNFFNFQISKLNQFTQETKEEIDISLDFLKSQIREKNKNCQSSISIIKSNFFSISNCFSTEENALIKFQFLVDEFSEIPSKIKEVNTENRLDVESTFFELSQTNEEFMQQILLLKNALSECEQQNKQLRSQNETFQMQIKGSSLNEGKQAELYTQRIKEIEGANQFLEKELSAMKLQNSEINSKLQESEVSNKKLLTKLEKDKNYLFEENENFKKENLSLKKLLEKNSEYSKILENLLNTELSNLSEISHFIKTKNSFAQTYFEQIKEISDSILKFFVSLKENRGFQNETQALQNKLFDLNSLISIVFSKCEKNMNLVLELAVKTKNSNESVSSSREIILKSKLRGLKRLLRECLKFLSQLKRPNIIFDNLKNWENVLESFVNHPKIKIEAFSNLKISNSKFNFPELEERILHTLNANNEIDTILNSFKEILANYLEERDKEVEELKEEMQFLTNNLEIKEEENQSILIEHEEEKHILEARIMELEAQLTTQGQIIPSNPENQNPSQRNFISELEKANEILNELINSLNVSLSETKEENESLKSTLSILHLEIEHYKIKFGTLEASEEDEAFEEFKNYSREDIKELKEKLDRTANDYTELQTKHDLERKKAEKLEEALKIANKKIVTLKEMMKIEDFEEEFSVVLIHLETERRAKDERRRYC